MIDLLENAGVGRQIDSKGFFAHQVFARFQAGDIDLLVQVMGDRAKHPLHHRIGQQFLVIAGLLGNGRKMILVPGKQSGIDVTDGDDFRFQRCVEEMTPARHTAGEFPTHQAQADDAEFDGCCAHINTRIRFRLQ